MKKIFLSIVMCLAMLVATISQSACSTDAYTKAQRGLYDIERSEKLIRQANEESYVAGDIDPAQAARVEHDCLIISLNVKAAKLALKGFNSTTFTGANKCLVFQALPEVVAAVQDAQQSGGLGIKNPESVQTFNTGISLAASGIAVLSAIEGANCAAPVPQVPNQPKTGN